MATIAVSVYQRGGRNYGNTSCLSLLEVVTTTLGLVWPKKLSQSVREVVATTLGLVRPH